MIVTHTSNPSIDYYLEIPGELISGVQRASSTYYLAGGKGLNVSMILNQLEIPSIATAFIGGFTGCYIREQIKECKYIELDAVEIEAANRINVKIRGVEETDINAKGPSITTENQQEMLKKLRNLKKHDWLLVCGSMAKDVSKDYLIEIANLVKEREAYLVLDIPGIKIDTIEKCQPHLIKPNVDELFDMFDLKDDGNTNRSDLINKLKEIGVKNILLSKGADGAEFYNEEGKLLVIQPALEPINTVGSGDSMLATVVGMLSEGKRIDEALIWGAAAGAATAVSKGLATRKKIEELKESIIIKQD